MPRLVRWYTRTCIACVLLPICYYVLTCVAARRNRPLPRPHICIPLRPPAVAALAARRDLAVTVVAELVGRINPHAWVGKVVGGRQVGRLVGR